MKLSVDEIRMAVADGRLKAITVDTSVVDALQRGLEHGPLKRLAQFRGSTTRLVLSDVVRNEIEAHLRKDAKDAGAALDKALRHVGAAWRVDAQRLSQTRQALVGEQDADRVALTRLDDWMAATGTQVVRAQDHASIDELLSRYFEHRPPFAPGAKKNEFPDALALLSLEAWADANDALVLAVSKDGDWAAFCEASKRLIAIDDLPTALACFQNDEARYGCQIAVARTRDNDGIGLLAAIERRLREWDESIEFSSEANSQFQWTEDMVEADYKVVGLSGVNDDGDIEPLAYGDGELVVSLCVDVNAKVIGYFTFDKWDTIDREYLSMGTGSSSVQEQIVLDVTVTLGGRVPEHPEVLDVEILPRHVSIDFGEIEPDWMRDRAGFEP
jgi:hypothetical protein